MVSPTPSQEWKRLPYSQSGEGRGTVLGCPPTCGKPCSSYMSSWPRNSRPRWQQEETVERQGEEKRENGRESLHNCYNLCFSCSVTNPQPRRAMVWNNHGTPNACRFFYHQVSPMAALSCHLVPIGTYHHRCPIYGPGRLTQAKGSLTPQSYNGQSECFPTPDLH